MGRAGADVPPHQIRKAPTVATSAPNTSAISRAWRLDSLPLCHIWYSPVAAST